MKRLLGQVVELTRARWADIPQERGVVIDVRTEYSDPIPPVMGVQGEIRDAITNLVFNAARSDALWWAPRPCDPMRPTTT